MLPPPAVPGRERERETDRHPSGLTRLWNAIKPPPAVKVQESGLPKEEKLRRRRLVVGTAAVLVAGALAWGIYAYIASEPDRAQKVFQDGMLLMGAGDSKGAEARFTKAVGIWPHLASGYLERGLVRKSMNQVDAAMADFEQALSLDSSLGAAHTALGTIYSERGDRVRAMNEFTQAINLEPNAHAFYERGELHELMGEHPQAIEDYNAAIHEEPDAPYVYRARALTRDEIGDHDGALADRIVANRIERH
ncbi:MAG TPA: tetratricopeptide repeat protein [Bryobacteraceae bacterium]